MEAKHKVIIVGGGLAGLACAVTLHEAGLSPRLVEGADGIGGRVRTDFVSGFQLDRGFQVFLSAYPEAGRMLDLKALDLHRFKAGALVLKDGKMHRLMDVFRHPRDLIASATVPIGTLGDKLRVARLRFQRRGTFNRADRSTEKFLRDYGFSEEMINGFFRAFYGGIFLERELHTSSRMFEFIFQMFTHGFATLPAKGMQAIPDQLGARLPHGSIHLNAPVRAVEEKAVIFATGERWNADAVVVATDARTAQDLLFEPGEQEVAWRAVTGVYFSANQSPLNEAIIALNGNGYGLVNNVCVLSDVVPEYAPLGKSLISVSVLGIHEEDGFEMSLLDELGAWFGAQTKEWQHLRTDRIRHALPEQLLTPLKRGPQKRNGVFLCGDFCTSASIEGAIVSGKDTAAAVLASLK